MATHCHFADLDPVALKNDAHAAMLIEDWHTALGALAAGQLLESAEAAEGEHFYTSSAAVLWLMGQRETASQIWRYVVRGLQGARFSRSDFAGGVRPALLLWYAAIALEAPGPKAEAEHLLEKKLAGSRAESWPGPIGAYLLGRLPQAEMMALAADSGSLAPRRLSQAHFYSAVAALENGDAGAAATAFLQSRDAGEPFPLKETEYFLARAEVSPGRIV